MKKDKYLTGDDIILCLKNVCVHNIDGYSSRGCSGGVSFYFDDTKHGRVEDPDMTGEIRVLSTKKEKGCYFLKVKFKKDKDHHE